MTASITKTKSMRSQYSDKAAYFTDRKDSEYANAFGTAHVHIKVPEHLAEEEDEFPSGERHYRVPVTRLRPRHFVDPS